MEPTLLVCLRMKVFGDIQARASGRWNTRKEGEVKVKSKAGTLGVFTAKPATSVNQRLAHTQCWGLSSGSNYAPAVNLSEPQCL